MQVYSCYVLGVFGHFVNVILFAFFRLFKINYSYVSIIYQTATSFIQPSLCFCILSSILRKVDRFNSASSLSFVL